MATTTTHLLGSLKLHDWHIFEPSFMGLFGLGTTGGSVRKFRRAPPLGTPRTAVPDALGLSSSPRIRRIRPAKSIHLTGPCGPSEIEFEIDEIGDFLDGRLLKLQLTRQRKKQSWPFPPSLETAHFPRHVLVRDD